MPAISRGFHGRRHDKAEAVRLAPGQYLTQDFPVLSAGPTPHQPLDAWTFEIRGKVDEPRSWTWQQFQALPRERITVDIQCVTKGPKFDTTWTGVSIDTLLEGVETSAEYVLAFCDGGYSTNLPLEDVRGGKAWGGVPVRRQAARPRAWRPGASARPAPVLLEEREVAARDRAAPRRHPRVLGGQRLSQLRRPMERTAVRRRLTWQLARVVELVAENARTTSLVLRPPDWPGHLAGQHVDVRLTAEDGYQTQRSYSIASAPEDEHLVLTVERLDDGEVSPYLTETVQPGDELELRGPVGGYFVWEESLGGPLLLVGGGSGVVPLRAMLRYHRAVGSDLPARLLYSARTQADLIYPRELAGFDTTITLTREDWAGRTGRVDRELLEEVAWPATDQPLVYVCGPTGFGQAGADALVALGHDASRVRAERFGPT